MNTALQRFRSFCELAAREPVQVDIHLGDLEEEARLRSLPRVSVNDNPFAERVVAFACALGSVCRVLCRDAAASVVVEAGGLPAADLCR